MTNYELIRKAIKENTGITLPEEGDKHARGVVRVLHEIRIKEEARADKKAKAEYEAKLLKESVNGIDADPLKKQLQKTLAAFDKMIISDLARQLEVLKKMVE
jgi:uncharacterized protein YpiB (UPF0302 family)